MRAPGQILLIACYELGHQPLSVAWPMAFLERAGYHPAVLDLAVEPLDADKILAEGNGWYRINGEWKMCIKSGATPKIRVSGGKKELLVPVKFNDGTAQIIQEFVW